MAEIVSSALVHETVSQLLSNLVQKYEYKEESRANRNLERLEMSHIRLEAALETSEKWQITDASLLRWRRKLKRAAQESDDTLHKCKQRILEDEHTEKEVRNSSFPVRIAHTTRSFVFSIVSSNKDESSSSAVRRFEWFADGASEFLRLLELGGRPRYHMPFDPLVRHLLNGKKLQDRIIQANKRPLFLQLVAYINAGYGIEAKFILMQTDDNASSTDIVGMAIQCLQLYAPLFNFKSAVETVKNKLVQLPTEDFSWVQMLIHITKNIGIIFTGLAQIGFAQTHYVASSMISTSSVMVVESQRSQDHQMFFWNQLLKYICSAMSQSWTVTNIGPYCLKPKILYKILHT